MDINSRIASAFTEEAVIKEFCKYVHEKTDIVTKRVRVPVGSDGVDYINFEKELKTKASHIVQKVVEGRFFFSPFLEIEKDKPTGGKRILSVATIEDCLFQRILYRVLEPILEDHFSKLLATSFAYRKEHSAQQAIVLAYRYIKQGFHWVLDADLSKFFDRIDHELLYDLVEEEFGENYATTYIKRFYSADRVLANSYKNPRDFLKKKPRRTQRKIGIPQGGVLSGMLANLYLHKFDCWLSGICSRNEMKYIRYADDFIVLCKKEVNVQTIYKQIESYLASKLKLVIHPLDANEKTKKLNMKEDSLNFLGFEITPRFIRVRSQNISKFKQRIKTIIEETEIRPYAMEDTINYLLSRISAKILGQESFISKCPKCNRSLKRRSWLAFFMYVTDVRQLRYLDIWIRKILYEKIFLTTGNRADAAMIRKRYSLFSLEKTYYRYHKECRKGLEFCICSFEDEFSLSANDRSPDSAPE